MLYSCGDSGVLKGKRRKQRGSRSVIEREKKMWRCRNLELMEKGREKKGGENDEDKE